MPQHDRQALSCRVGNLLSAFHALAGLCSALHLSLSAGLEHPQLPLAETSAAALGPAPQLPAQQPEVALPPCVPAGSSSGSSGSRGSGADGGSAEEVASAAEDTAAVEGEAAESKATGMEGVEQAPPAQPTTALPPPPAPSPPPQHTSSVSPPARGAGQPLAEAEPAIAAALRPFGEAFDDLIDAVSEEGQLRAWCFLLDYGAVRPLSWQHLCCAITPVDG